MRRIVLAAGIALTTVAVVARPALAGPGNLDLNFGGTGHVDAEISGSQDAVDVVVRPSGRVAVISVGGTVAQFLANGDPDPGFGSGGVVAGTAGVNIEGAGLDAHGNLLMAGYMGDDVYVARLLPNGDPDASFAGGSVTTTFPQAADMAAVAVDAQDRVVVAGETGVGTSRFALVRYLHDGQLDGSFGGDGRVTTQILGSDYARALAIGADGTIVAVGSAAATDEGLRSFGVARYRPNGHLDQTFSGDGKTTVRMGSTSDAKDVLIQPNGAIVVGGNYFDSTGIDWALARYTSSGTLDHTFSGDGKLTTKIGGGADYFAGIIRQQSGDLIAAGVKEVQGARSTVLIRYHQNGTFDHGFGTNGRVIQDYGDGPSTRNIAKAPNAKVVVGFTFDGATDQDMGAARFQAGP
jgi:uncharacterized delta-60 repeat protein